MAAGSTTIDRRAAVPLIASGELSLEMTNAGWAALKDVFALYGIDVIALPIDHSAGLINSELPALVYAAMVRARR